MRWLSRVIALAAVLGAAGCKQGVGERCQVDSDCEDNLICVLPAGGTAQAGGTCQPRGGADAAIPGDDQSVPADGGADADVPADMAVAADGGGDMAEPADMTSDAS